MSFWITGEYVISIQRYSKIARFLFVIDLRNCWILFLLYPFLLDIVLRYANIYCQQLTYAC